MLEKGPEAPKAHQLLVPAAFSPWGPDITVTWVDGCVTSSGTLYQLAPAVNRFPVLISQRGKWLNTIWSQFRFCFVFGVVQFGASF